MTLQSDPGFQGRGLLARFRGVINVIAAQRHNWQLRLWSLARVRTSSESNCIGSAPHGTAHHLYDGISNRRAHRQARDQTV